MANNSKPVGSPHFVDLADLEKKAKEIIGEMAYAYYAGGAGYEQLLADNVAAWSRYLLHPKVLVDVSTIDTSTRILGTEVTSPVMIAPTAIQGMAHPTGERASALGAQQAGAGYILSSLSTCSLEDVAAAAPHGLRFMQVYVLRDRGATAEMVQRAVAAGYKALVLTVDAPVSGLRIREITGSVHLPPGLSLPNLPQSVLSKAKEGGFMSVVTQEVDPSLNERDIDWLATISGLPIIVKGVARGDDARRAVDAGASGVVVSNHGARQLDDAPATADLVSEIAHAVNGDGEVWVDGGIRRPQDALKAVAMGANAVLLGRPTLWSLANAGADGVQALLTYFIEDFRRTMALCGVRSVSEITETLVAKRN
jgi:isopentenyl diphosphate isomerase/L-lactate dehydrogenase-like FMN-dependent dehydrogenase